MCIFKEHGCAFLIAVLIFFAGILLFIIHMIMANKWRKDRTLLYLSLFSIFLSFWLLDESRMLQLFVSNHFLCTSLCFLGLLIFPIPLTMYLANAYTPHHKPFYHYFTLLFSANFLICLLLQLTGVKDLFETIAVVNFLLIALMSTMLVSLAYEIICFHNQKASFVLKSLLVPGVFGLMEIIRFLFGNYSATGAYMSLGLIFYIVLLGVHWVCRMKKLTAAGYEALYYEELAYTDPLVNGKNRTAYYKALSDAKKKPDASLYLALFDLNDLKFINDTYGHGAGDAALKLAFTCIESAFGSIGECFRIGGDEFAVLAQGCEGTAFDKAASLFREFERNIAAREDVAYPFKISMGYGKYHASSYDDFDDFASEVDQKMYENKKRDKALSPLHSEDGQEKARR